MRIKLSNNFIKYAGKYIRQDFDGLNIYFVPSNYALIVLKDKVLLHRFLVTTYTIQQIKKAKIIYESSRSNSNRKKI